jgi:hypothetical protein
MEVKLTASPREASGMERMDVAFLVLPKLNVVGSSPITRFVVSLYKTMH